MSFGIEIREAHYPGRAPIDAYGNGGFRFAEMSHRGSLLCLPSGIHGWQRDETSTLSIEDFDRVVAEAEEIEILLVGTGPQLCPLGKEVRARLREAGMAVEVMATGAAVRTYNVLLAEDRHVAAALVAVD